MKILKMAKLYLSSALIVAIISIGAISLMVLKIGAAEGWTVEQGAAWAQAIGSVAAILLTLGLTSYQNERQKRVETLREAANDLRIATLADAIVKEGLDAVRKTEKSERNWVDGIGYVFHDRPKIEAAQILIRTLAAEPLFAELIAPVIDTHSLLVSVQSSSDQLIGQGTFKGNSRFTTLWDRRSKQVADIEARLASAVAIATTDHENAELALRHF